MGNVHANWTHCVESVGHSNGNLTMVAANGDELYLEYEDTTTELSFPILIAGGTGRFSGATGGGTVHYMVEQVLIPGCEVTPTNPCFDLSTPWGWQATITGTISY